MINREELTKKVTNLIADMGVRWGKHFDEPPSVGFIKSTAALIISEVIIYQLEQILKETEESKC